MFTGLNYNVTLPGYAIDKRILFIGLGINHPSGGEKRKDKVSVLGFAANDGKSADEFIGNFFLRPQFEDENVRKFLIFLGK